jgi:hypothetical protein
MVSYYIVEKSKNKRKRVTPMYVKETQLGTKWKADLRDDSENSDPVV